MGENAPSLPALPEGRQPGSTAFTASEAPTASAQAKKAQTSIGACDACRLRKVRCLANESSMSSKCQRCTRANRECVYTTHSKTRRRKRTDTRVKELEEKVRGLSMLLENRAGTSNHSSAERDVLESTNLEEDLETEDSKGVLFGGFGEATAKGSSPLGFPILEPQTTSRDPSSAARARSLSKLPSYDQSTEVSLEHTPIFPDVVARGLLSMDKATELYKRYVNELLPLYPAVALPPDCTAAKLRESRPILFLAVLAASAGASNPALNLRLNKEIQQVYATKVTIEGRKSLEICQAMLISILWTYPPDKLEDLKFHQQITQAATMALDLGLAQKPKASANNSRSYDVYHGEDESSSPGREVSSQPVLVPKRRLLDSGAPDSRRTLLACYVFCASVSMSLRLPNMLRFSSWMAECVEYLEKSENAAPTDKQFIAWVKLQRIVDECGSALALDDPRDTNVTLADQRVQATLAAFEKQLEAWKRNANDIMNPFLQMTYHGNNIYLHEIALHPDHDAEDFRPPFFIAVKLPSTQPQTVLTPPYINAIIQCITSADDLITTFLNMSVREILQCPTLVFVRVIYASVILIKLSISAAMPSSELGNILDPASNKVETYLEQLLIHLKAVATLEDGGRHALSSRFLGILTKLKFWFQHQKPQSPGDGSIDGELGRGNDSIAVKTALTQGKVPSNHVPVSESEPADETSYRGPLLQYELPTSLYEPPAMGKGDYLIDFGKSSTVTAMDQSDTQPMQPTAWSTNFPTASGYPSASMPYSYPMDADPTLFTHLVNAELDQNNQDNWMPDADAFGAMDYSSMPEFNWATWPQQ